jgi:hypothetical protein
MISGSVVLLRGTSGGADEGYLIGLRIHDLFGGDLLQKTPREQSPRERFDELI